MRELQVELCTSAHERQVVGTLVEDRRRVWFQYDDGFRATGLEISPLRLPIDREGLIEHTVRPGVPLPGVFSDARPDGWGLKLLHRAFQSRGTAASAVSPLEELAFLGDRTMGALCFQPSTGPSGALDEAVELGALAAHAQQVFDDRVEAVLPALVRAGGSSGGARPKALIGLPTEGGPGVRFGEGSLPEGWEAWLVKFPTSTDDPDVGRREAAWMSMAREAGLELPASRILSLDGVGDAFAVRRFDRPGGDRRLHMLSAAGALDVDFRTAAADYEHLLRAANLICKGDQSQVLALFRLAVFNVAAVNEDDHLKNLAFLLRPGVGWRLAPAFDLTYAPAPGGERATTVAGAGREVGHGHLLDLARRVGLKAATARRIIEEVCAATDHVARHLEEASCAGPVSRAASAAVQAATMRVQG
jgi:serine/threonine-protein kinase HipA